jgi:hypothetical protein
MATTKHTEDTTQTSPKLVISYEKKVGRPNYGIESAFLSLEIDTPIGASPEECAQLAHSAFGHIKAQVFRQLGVMYGTDDQTGVVQAIETVQAPPAPAASPGPRPQAPSQPRRQNPPPARNNNDKDGLWRDLAANPGDWWDNRETKKGRQPDYKHKKSGDALWADNAPDWFGASDEEPF